MAGHDRLVVTVHHEPAKGGAEQQAGVVLVAAKCRHHRFGLVKQGGHVHTRNGTRCEAERGERAVPAAHVGVGEDDVVARFARHLLERRARVGDDHEPARDLLRRQPEIVQGLLVDAPVAVGLDRGSALARYDHQRAVKAVAQCARDLMRIGGVEHGERCSRRARDHLRGKGGAAHAGQHDVVEPVLPDAFGQAGEFAEQPARDVGRVQPAEPVARHGLGRGAP